MGWNRSDDEEKRSLSESGCSFIHFLPLIRADNAVSRGELEPSPASLGKSRAHLGQVVNSLQD